ncbi:PepSY domain-containing protein [Rhodococcus sp. NPDC059968]|jgi:uncharacterized membrane protein YkoI|uniref:PepSY domain-containing protein n=1 Tax=Rhodococcus sp. NPDC059968 TaxID=3347017 RepID=UPI0036710E42
MTTRIVRCASLIPVVAASALLLGGCGSDSGDTSSTTSVTTAAATTTSSTGTVAAAAITKEQAEQIAIGAVPGGTVANSEQQLRDGKAVWHVHIRDTRGYDYDVDVDAATGAVVPENQNGGTTAAPAPAPAPPAGGAVTQEQAEQIAVATVPGGTVANAEEQHRDGKTVWHIHIRDAKGWDYDVNVDASTGAVLPDN